MCIRAENLNYRKLNKLENKNVACVPLCSCISSNFPFKGF